MDDAVVVSTPSEAASTPVATPEVSQDRRNAVVPEGDAPPATPPNGEAKPDESAVPKGVQKRIDRAVREKYEAQARTKMLEERLAALEQQRQAPQQQAQQTDPGMPTIDKYDNFDQYVAAKAEYIARQQIERTLTERERRQAVERETAERTKTVGEWQKRVEKATAEMPDFEEVVASSEVPMTEPMRQAIMESDVGPKLAYYLANNPDEATDIARMTPIGAIRALGRIEERLSKPAEKKSSSAPAPLTPLGGSAKVSKDPGDMSQAEFEKWRRSVIKAR